MPGRGRRTPLRRDRRRGRVPKQRRRSLLVGVELGRAIIRQRKNDPVLEISGEVSGRGDPVGTTFASLFGVIRGRSIYLFYENRDGERGLIHGAIIDDKPRVLTLTYNDLAGFDRNQDPSGTIVLTRV